MAPPTGGKREKRVEIKRIDNTAARQVTFSKRRRGLFKKAQELSILCDADVALIVFSSTRKLFHFASSSMQEILQKYGMHTKTLQKSDQQLEDTDVEYASSIASLRQQLSETSLKLRQLKGEELDGLEIENLLRLEKDLEVALHRVLKMKEDRVLERIQELQKKSDALTEENARLQRQVQQLMAASMQNPVANSNENIHVEEGQSSDSIVTAIQSADGSLDDNDVDFNTFLKLGLP